MVKDLLNFLKDSPTAFQATANLAKEFEAHDFTLLKENEAWKLEKGKDYYLSRNGSSLLAFRIGKKVKDITSFLITASHSDCPSFKLKPNAIISDANGVRLNVEVYGGPLYYPWLDRPLSLAGRLLVKEEKGVKSLPFDLKKDFCLIPSLAIHRNRGVNSELKLNAQIDMLPLCGLDKDFDFKAYLAKEAKIKKENLLGYDLYLYNREEPRIWGANDEFIAAQHIDNLESAYTSLKAFLNKKNEHNIMVYACFDNEEVGSLTRQGAASDFLKVNLQRIAKALDIDYLASLGNSMLLSIDNAHAINANHPEKEDKTNGCHMNAGVVIKYNANQSYTSDGLSSAIFADILDAKKIPYQYFSNRSDERGGSTLGNLCNGQVSFLALDIGLAQLAMHSCYESAGVADIKYMTEAVKAFYQINLRLVEDGSYNIK